MRVSGVQALLFRIEFVELVHRVGWIVDKRAEEVRMRGDVISGAKKDSGDLCSGFVFGLASQFERWEGG